MNFKAKQSYMPRNANQAQEGFSLVELLVVLAIMGLLVGLVAPRVLRYLDGAKVESAKAQVHNIESALELYYIDNGRYPTTEEGLSALEVAPTSAASWNGPYLKGGEALRDPWGHPYAYRGPEKGDGFSVHSLGKDGKEGGNGDDSDIP